MINLLLEPIVVLKQAGLRILQQFDFNDSILAENKIITNIKKKQQVKR